LNKKSRAVLTKKSGRYVKIRFDRHMQIGPGLSATELASRQASQKTDIAADRAYADKLKDSIYSQLTSKSITFDQAMTQVSSDKYIDWKNWEFTIGDPSVNFDTANSPVGFKIMNSDAFMKKLSSTKKGEISEPFLVQLDFSEEGKEADNKDAMWVILTVDNEFQGKTINYGQWLSAEIDKLGVNNESRALSFINRSIATAYAYNPFECSNGYSGKGVSFAGDVILESRYRSESATTSEPAANVRGYIRPSRDAYAYSGCTLPSTYSADYVAGEGSDNRYYFRSELSGSDHGCIYKFSHIDTDHVNQCCGGNHNNHVIWFDATSSLFANDSYNLTHGKWDFFNGARSDGSSYSINNEEFDDESYGTRNSGRIVRSVENGETLYIRGYWIIKDNHEPTTTQGSPLGSEASPYGYATGTTQVTLSATGTDTDTVYSQDKVSITVSTEKKNNDGTWSAVTGGSGTSNQLASGTAYEKTVDVSAGTYRWRAYAKDWHDLTGSYSSYQYFVIPPDAVAVIETPDFSCTAKPESGTAPLTAKVTVTATGGLTGNYNYDMDSTQNPGYEYNDRGTVVYYTYAAAGQYTVSVQSRTNNSLIRTCSTTVTVKDPTSGSGGEVAP